MNSMTRTMEYPETSYAPGTKENKKKRSRSRELIADLRLEQSRSVGVVVANSPSLEFSRHSRCEDEECDTERPASYSRDWELSETLDSREYGYTTGKDIRRHVQAHKYTSKYIKNI